MSRPFRYRTTVVYAKAGCRRCHGQGATGASWEDGGEPCECIHDQLIGKDEFIRLADGDIEIREAE